MSSTETGSRAGRFIKINIENKMLAGFILVFIILFATGWFFYRDSRSVTDSGRWVAHTNEVLCGIAGTHDAFADYENSIKNALLEEKNPVPDRVVSIMAVESTIKQLRDLTRDNAFQQKQLDTLSDLVRQKAGLVDSSLALLDEGSFNDARRMVASPKAEDLKGRVYDRLQEIRREEQKLYAQREKRYNEQVASMKHAFVLLFALVVFVLVSAYLVLRKNLVIRVQHEKNIQKLDKALKARAYQLEAANKELDSFSYSVSHDLRTPLRAINGYTSIFEESYLHQMDDEARRVMNIVVNNTRKMGQLIDDLLAFSRLNRKELVRTTMSMNKLVNDVAADFKYAERNRHIEFVIENLPDIQGDMNMLKQVWVNLISNAVKYSAGTDRTIIRIGSYKESDEVIYTIADNGVGFDMLFYDKLFGVFQRLHNTDEFDGTGVGLAIVQRIINKHKGKIWANAVVNAGATFYFSIPNEN